MYFIYFHSVHPSRCKRIPSANVPPRLSADGNVTRNLMRSLAVNESDMSRGETRPL